MVGDLINFIRDVSCAETGARYLRQLNIDKEIISMKNFNVYDPMKRGQGLTLEGQSLAHLEVGFGNPNFTGQCE